MSKVGLVLGGGGVTGAAFETGALIAIELATGWRAADADVVVGTSCGAVISAMVRGPGVSIESLVGDARGREEFAEDLHAHLFRRSRLSGVGRWARHGLLRGLRHPGLTFALGSPAAYHAAGIAEWVEERFGPFPTWPSRPTIITAYDLTGARRVAFGTEDAPDVRFADAVAASSSVPILYQPYSLDGHSYVDGGVASGTNSDLVLGNIDPLDLVIVVAPIGVSAGRKGHRFYEPILDRAGRVALAEEQEKIKQAWPDCEVLILTPTDSALATMRPNPLSAQAAVPSFIRTLRSMRRELARPEIWDVLERHLLQAVGR